MFYKIERTTEEIDEVFDWAVKGNEEGSHFPGMTYEQGILAALDWLTGATEDRPDEE